MKFRIILLLFLCALLFSSAEAQLTGKNRWVNVKSKSFNIIGDATEKDLRDVAKQLEQFRETFRVLFKNMNHNSSTETNVVVFRGADSFRPFRIKRPDGKPDERVAGYFLRGETRNYIALSTQYSKEDVYGIVFHEYIHYLMDNNLGRARLPAWLNEGIAEYYQTFKIVDDQKVFLGDLQREHVALLRSSRLMPMSEFLTVSNASLHGTGGRTRSIFYAQAWLFMHFLMHADNGIYRDKLNRYTNARIQNVSDEEAFRDAFQADHATLEAALRRYLNQPTMERLALTLSNKIAIDNDLRTTPLSEAGANTYLGDLLYHLRDHSEAEKYLARAIQLEPGSSIAKTSLGLVRMRQRKFDEARLLLEAAVKTESSSYYAHYNYAYVLSRESMDEFGYVRSFPDAHRELMQNSLRRSIQLKPDFAPSYSLLAFVNLVNGRDLEEAGQLIQRAIRIRPGDQDLALLAARIYLRQNETDLAHRIASRISANPSRQDLKTQADQLLTSIDRVQNAAKVDEWSTVRSESLGSSEQILIDRRAISAEEVERLEKERVLRNLNRLIVKPAVGEDQKVGRFRKISCAAGSVSYEFGSGSNVLIFTSKDFASINTQILHEGTRNLEIGCTSDISDEVVVVNYRKPTNERTQAAGILTAVSFVPKDFRLMTEAELNEPQPIVVGGPPTDLAANEEKIKAEMEEMIAKQREFQEKQQRQAIIDQILSQLRMPQTGEIRGTGALNKIECTNKTRVAVVTLNGQPVRLRLPEKPEDLRVFFFVPDINHQVGCGTSLSDVKAIITYLPDARQKNEIAGELRAIEFVPASVSIE